MYVLPEEAWDYDHPAMMLLMLCVEAKDRDEQGGKYEECQGSGLGDA